MRRAYFYKEFLFLQRKSQAFILRYLFEESQLRYLKCKMEEKEDKTTSLGKRDKKTQVFINYKS